MKPYTSADQALVRELNLSLVLRHIHNIAPISRSHIAQDTGLNKSTVSSLVQSLLDRRLIHETGVNSIGTGRPARMLEINPEAGGIVGVEFGVDYIAVALTDFTGEILWRRDEVADFANGQEATLAQTLELIKEAVDFSKLQALYLLGLGISTPGTVNLDEGILIFAPNMQWKNVPLQAFFTEKTGLKVFIENDANAAAIAENLFGAARQSENFIFVFAGIGIGCGLFLNGKLHRGQHGYAGEIGHSPIMVEPFQAPCHCGNRGCWETYANQHSIIQRVEARLNARRNSIIPRLMEERNAPLSISIIKEAADTGDEEAIEALTETGEAMGIGIATLINVLNPERVVFGGPLSIVGEYLLPPIKQIATKHTLPEMMPKVEITLSKFGKDSSLIGAASMVVNNIFTNPMYVERRLSKKEKLPASQIT